MRKLQQPETMRDASAWRTAALELIPGCRPSGRRRAIVIPHEVLWRVPFEALPVAGGYLADTTSVVYQPSVTALVRTPPPPPREVSTNRLVSVASPELAPVVVEEIARTAPGWAIRNGEVAAKEALAIAAGAEADRVQGLAGALATEATLAERLPQADVIHLAAPFRVNGASPLFSPCSPPTRQRRSARSARGHEPRPAPAWRSCPTARRCRWGRCRRGRRSGQAWRAAGVPAVVLPGGPAAVRFDRSARGVHARLQPAIRRTSRCRPPGRRSAAAATRRLK